eukprot:m.713466 g.713466  ORF g.713466 m.713466 type:complete len:85 (+) comp22971_c1_seq21:2030-2284(+)
MCVCVPEMDYNGGRRYDVLALCGTVSALLVILPIVLCCSSAVLHGIDRMFLFKSNFQMLYFVSFPVVLVGLGMYIKAPERIESS